MDNTVNFPMPDDVVTIERSEEFIIIAHKIGDMLKALPLTNTQHNDLVAAITDQVQAGESAAFKQGFDIGMKIMMKDLCGGDA